MSTILDRIHTKFRICSLALLWVFATTFANSALLGQDASGLTKDPTWKWPSVADFNEQLQSYLDLFQVPPAKQEQIQTIWHDKLPDESGPDFLNHLVNVASLVDPRVAAVQEQLAKTVNLEVANPNIDLTWFDARVPGWLQDNLKLAVARHLAQYRHYDEALAVLETLDAKHVADPSTWMFYSAVCYHHLLKQRECLERIDELLQRESEIVSRYAVTAKLMKSDIQPLKVDSLDEVARLMQDVERRLDLGRAGTRVQDNEKKIVDKLDKMINQIEQQLQQQKNQQQQQQRSNGQGDAQNQRPLDGTPPDVSGPGDVDQKNIGKKDGWGDLPPAQRQEALQNITKDLPSHYREVIEAYFKRLATGE